MTSNNRTFKRVLAMLLLVTTVLTSLASVGTLGALASVEYPYGEEEDSMVRTSLDEIQNVLTSTTYSEYLNNWKDSASLVTDESIQIDLVKFSRNPIALSHQKFISIGIGGVVGHTN